MGRGLGGKGQLDIGLSGEGSRGERDYLTCGLVRRGLVGKGLLDIGLSWEGSRGKGTV